MLAYIINLQILMSVLRLQAYVGAMECVQTQRVLTRAVVRKAMRGISKSAEVRG